MQAWTVNEFGHFSKALELKTLERPEPKADQVLVKLNAVSVNFPDLLVISGDYQYRPSLPFVPGTEAAGVVVRAGEMSGFEVGQRVMGVQGNRVMGMTMTGAFAEFMLMDALTCFPVPEKMSDQQAAAFVLSSQTAWFALTRRAALREGETLLVHGGAGSVGTAAIQIGKLMGAEVIATAGSAEKLAVCRELGANHVINYRDSDFADKVREITGGRGANVIFDVVGGNVFERSTHCIAWEGRLIVAGFAGGNIPEIAMNLVLIKNFSIVGIFWGNYLLHNPGLMREAQVSLDRLFDEGKLVPYLGETYALDALPDALLGIEKRRAIGKTVITI